MLYQSYRTNNSFLCAITTLGSVAIFSLASLSANASTLISSTAYLDYELPKSVQDSCSAQQNCPEIEVKHLKTNHEWINDITNKRINELVVDNQPHEAISNTTNSSVKDVKMAIDKFTQAQFTDMPDGNSWGYSLMVTPDYLGHVGDFETFEINAYVFTGGAHGASYSEYLIFDPSTKRQVGLADMLQTSKKPRFEALAYNAYKAWVKTLDTDLGSYEKNWPFTLSNNVTLTDKGIDIRYQQYAIGPYVYGMPVLSIPYNKLHGTIKPHYIAK